MINSKHFSHFAISSILALALIFSGCSSTDSDGNDEDSIAFFNSGEIGPGETFSHTFDEEGSLDYYCEIHAPNMQGQITVTSSEDAAERDTVRMENNQFLPRNLSIAPDTEVLWVNNQDHAHHVRSGNPPSDDGDGGGY